MNEEHDHRNADEREADRLAEIGDMKRDQEIDRRLMEEPSKTPRTDAQYKEYARRDNDVQCVDISFARQLETELNKANREIHKQDCLYDSKKKQWLNSVVCVCADFPNVAFYIGQLESERDQLQRTVAELAASEAKLRAALQPFNGIACGARPDDFINPTIRFGDLENVAKALSTPPSEALKPWVEFVRDASSSYIFQTQARELLKSINV